MSSFSLNKTIFEETHTENIQLQTDLSNLQFQFLVLENNNLSLSKNLESLESIENPLLDNEIWTEFELSKFKILYNKTIDSFEKQDNNNQELEDEINLLQNNEFKESFNKSCCEKNCLQTQYEYSVALSRYLNFKSLSKSYQDIYLLGIISATKWPKIIWNSKKSKLSTEYIFEGKSICLNTFRIIYGLGQTRWKNLREHFIENDINIHKNSKTNKISNNVI